MPTLRWFKATGSTSAGAPKLRWFKATASGTAPATPKLRWFKATAIGSAAPVLVAPAGQTLEPLTAFSLTVTTAPGSSTPDSYVWRVISGTVTLSGTGATVTGTTPAPFPPNPVDLVIGVRGITAGASSPEVTTSVTVLPCGLFTWQTNKWVGARLVALTGP